MNGFMLFIAKWLSLGFGSGKAPVAPGTFGTLAAIPIYLLVANASPTIYLLLTIIFFVIGIWACDKYSKYLGVHDHGSIVWDEVVGYLITMAFVVPDIVSVLLGFILFRLFDIWKPFPIKQLDEKVHGGLGIMIDDVLAGIYAALVLQLILHFAGGV